MKKNGMGGACGTDGGEESCVRGFGWGNLREGNHLGNLDVDGRMVLKLILKEMGWMWTELIWLKIGTCGELL